MDEPEEVFVEGGTWHPGDVGQGNGWRLRDVAHPKSYGARVYPLHPTASVALTVAERNTLERRPARVRLLSTAAIAATVTGTGAGRAEAVTEYVLQDAYSMDAEIARGFKRRAAAARMFNVS